MNKLIISIVLILQFVFANSQEDESLIYYSIELEGFTVHSSNEFDSKRFMKQVMDDSSFYQSFKNLRYYNHFSNGKIWVYNKKNYEKAYEYISVKQKREKNMMWQNQTVEESEGKMRNRKGELKFVTASMYYDLFFPSDTVYVNKKITNVHNEPVGDSKFDQYKHQLKLMMFNPGEDVAGVPIVGKKMSIFDEDMVPFYNYKVIESNFQDKPCYLFSVVAKPEFKKSKTVIKSLYTYFDKTNMDVLQREYYMEYSSLLFQFKVKIFVKNIQIGDKLVPKEIKYNGWWDVPFKTTETLKFWITTSNWFK